MTATPQNAQSNGSSTLNSGANAYLRTKVLSASPEELRLMLLDGAIKFARQGLEGLLSKDFESQYLGISQCRDIVFELLTTIKHDIDPDLAARVKGLYMFLYTHLTEASFEKSQPKLEKVIQLLEYERETWVLLMQRLATERGKSPPPAPVSLAPAAAAKTASPLSRPSQASPSAPRPALSVQG